jgi:apolipoprotein N-acyltransferase
MEDILHKSSGSASQDTTGSRSMSKDVTDLVDTYIALAKANVTQKAADAASVSVTGIAIAVLAFFFIFFGSFALAWWIGNLISSIVGGFLIVAGIFGVGVALILAFKERLIYPVVRNTVVKKVYE